MAAGLNADGSIRLPAYGARSVIGRPLLQDGDANAVKSPASIAAVGTNAMLSVGVWWVTVPWYAPKKNSLSLAMGPPTVPPNWFRSRPSSFRLPPAPMAANRFVAL